MAVGLILRRLILTIFVASLVAPPRGVLAQRVEPAAPGQAKIAAALDSELRTASQTVSFLVILDDQLDPAAVVQAAGADDFYTKRAALYAALTTHARQTQAPLRSFLDAAGVEYTPHYLINMIEVRGEQALALQLAQRPEVSRLVRNPTVRGLDVVEAGRAEWHTLASLPRRNAAATLPWGLTYTNADDVWALGFRGQGIIVAGQDTGVLWEHPALQPAYRGWDAASMTAVHAYNWYDAWGRDPIADSECAPDAQVPCDDDAASFHGTHTLGTVAGDATVMGDTVIGMAPDATWIACRNMRDGFGTPSSYTACFEFFLAPYPQGGDPTTDGRPELAPHVINNSWSCPPSEGCDVESLRQVVETMRAAGTFVVASAGNGGPDCSSVNNPIGTHDAVISVGAHGSTGAIAAFSSRGPVTVDGSGRLKPDLSAPGVAVRSAGLTQGGAFSVNISNSGTSMSAPHVAGAVALLWSLDPALIGDIDATEEILLQSATPAPVAACTDSGVEQSPNPVFGYGRLDVLRAAELALGNRAAIATNTIPARSGVIRGGGAVDAGGAVTLTATLANPGYTFVNWTENGVEVSAGLTYTLTASGNRVITANFALAAHRQLLPFIAQQ